MNAKLAMTVLLPVFSLTAQAQSTAGIANGYVGLGLGRASTNLSEATDFAVTALTTAGYTGITSQRDESDTAFKFYGGYRFNQHFALEGGYINFGDFKARVSAAAPIAGTVTANWKPHGYYIDAVGIVPVNEQFSLFGKAGAIFSRLDARVAASAAGVAVRASADENETNLKLGVGAQYEFTRNFGVRLEYERVNNVGDSSTTGEGDIGLWSLGLHLRF